MRTPLIALVILVGFLVGLTYAATGIPIWDLVDCGGTVVGCQS